MIPFAEFRVEVSELLPKPLSGELRVPAAAKIPDEVP